MFSSNKHSYLHSRTTVSPRLINRCVDNARNFETVDQFDENPGFNRLTSEQPCLPIENCDITRRPLAFGKLALPKLRRELHHEDTLVVIQAISSLSDLVLDPEHNYEAIKLRIPDRLEDLILSKDYPIIRERALMTLATISNLLDGKMQIIKNKKLLETIIKAIDDEEISVRCKALILLDKISDTWMMANLLNETNLLNVLIEKLEQSLIMNEKYVDLILLPIKNLIYCEGKQIALKKGLFNILVNILNVFSTYRVIVQCMKILAILMETAEGKEMAIKLKVLNVLFKFLQKEKAEIYENAACAMVFATIKTEAILKAIKIPGLCDRLLFLILNAHEVETKKFCMQVLTNLSAHRDIKMGFLEDHFQELEKVNFKNDETGQQIKYNLLYNELR